MKRAAASLLPDGVVRSLAYRDLHRRGKDPRPVAIVYGNCQAEPLRRILATHPDVVDQFRLVRVPPVHEITPAQLVRLQRLLPAVGLFITQHVKPGYRGLELGSDELIARLAPDAVVFRFPVAYFAGPFPFQVYVNLGGDPIAFPAPLTEYHDLRIMWAAARGWSERETLSRIARMELDPVWVTKGAELSLAELALREDVLGANCARISKFIAHPSRLANSFHTVNHPSNEILRWIAQQLLIWLRLDKTRFKMPKYEYLGQVRAPREPAVMIPLGAVKDECFFHWYTPKGAWSPKEVIAAHLRLYADRPDVLTEGLIKHDARLHEMRGMWPRSWRST